MAGNAVQFPQRLGPYELTRLLATGGMAEVYLARRDGPHGFSKTIALKRILPQLAMDQDFVSMFIDEARVCAQLSHPNLVQVFDFGEAVGELYMAMEYVDGTTCAKVVRKAAALGEFVPVEATMHIVLSVVRGLEYAHAAVDMNGVPLGLIHRDVSPGNILIALSGAVKLGDFGIARADEFERRTEEGQLKGKLGYMSPEQVTGRKIDARSDLFTLGIVLAELLVSRPLFGTGNELDVLMRIRDADLSVFERNCGHVPDDLRVIVRKSLSREPSDRYQTATEFADAVDDFARQSRVTPRAARLVSWLEHARLVTVPRSGEHPLEAISKPPKSEPPEIVNVRSEKEPLIRVKTERMEPLDLVEPEPGSGPVSPAEYRVLLGDEEVGPIPYPKLVELFATGKAGADTLVARGTGIHRLARDLPELARLLVSPALTDFPEKSAEDRIAWRLDRRTHAFRFFDLAIRKETGLLAASQKKKNRRKKFFFVDGGPTFTTSTDKNELLGQRLIARGLALPMEIDMALALCPRYGGRLGDALVGLGVIRPIELFRALVAQTHERFVDLLRWKEGDLEFVRGVRAEGETILHGTSPFELITRGVIRGYSGEEISAVLSPFFSNEVRPAGTQSPTISELHMGDRLEPVLTSIVRPVSIQELVQVLEEQGRATRDEVLAAVLIGLSAGILVTTGWPPTSDQPSVPTMRM